MVATQKIGGTAKIFDPLGAISDRIRHVVGSLGTQQRLSDLTGLSLGTISTYSKDCSSAKLENLQKIADAGDVSIEWLLTGVEAAEQVIDAESDTKPRDGAGEVDWEVWERAYQLTSEWERMMYERGEGRMHIEDTVRMARMHYDRLLREKSKE